MFRVDRHLQGREKEYEERAGLLTLSGSSNTNGKCQKKNVL